MQVDRLTGFCLLVRREVLDKIGGFDERFGIGFFDDDDLCVRAREAGFRLLVALNVFIHHFGSRTFRGLGIDCEQQLTSNFVQFKAKWGDRYAAGYRWPGDGEQRMEDRGSKIEKEESTAPKSVDDPRPDVIVPSVTVSSSRRVSLCIIAKNEEANLPACLASAADLVDETIVVDTGSTDATKEIAGRYGAGVFDFPWVDSFAAARNETLRRATGDWIFWLDADDRVDEANRQKLRALFAGLKDENVAYDMKCLCVPDPISKTATVVDHVRLFRNHPEIRWEFRVHEQILPAVRRLGGDVRWADIVIQHTGYQDPVLRRRKLERDLRLLHLDNAERPDHPFILFNLGSVFLELARPAEALPVLRRSLELSHPADSIVRKLYALVVQCHRQMGQPGEALAACQAGRAYYPDDSELLFQEALVRREQQDVAGAENCLVQLLHCHESPHFASVATGLGSYLARHNLGILYQEQGRSAEAEAQWRAALAEQPEFAPAWLGLAELHLVQERWPELEEISRDLSNGLQMAVEAAVLRARGHLARREFTSARELLEETIAQKPQALLPRIVLSHVLLQEGSDWDAAEEALRNILKLEAANVEAQRNLAVLLRRQGESA